jgi:hypothetical protein
MAQPAFSNIYDPIQVSSLVGDRWLKEAKIVTSGIAELDGRPIPEGTLVYSLKERILQDRSGQAVAAGGTISTAVPIQTKTQHPRVWRYDSITEDDVLMDIEAKGIAADEYAGLANSISKAALQYLDDSMVSVIEGSAAALTTNNTGNGAVISLDGIITAMAARGERGMNFMGGGMAMHSALYWKLASLGVVASTSNTFGNAVQDKIVQTGALPMQVVGMTPIVSDKFALFNTHDYYLYLISLGALALRASGAPTIESSRLTASRQFGTVTNFKIGFGIGFKGLTYVGAGSEMISDTDLETSANWNLSYTAQNAVGLGRFWTASA